MLDSEINDLLGSVEGLKLCISAGDRACCLAHGDVTALPTVEFKQVLGRVPQRADWVVFNHCAGITRLYAIYECFAVTLIESWLRSLPGLFENYKALPDVLRGEHKAGVARLLMKVGKGRYQHLTTESLLRGLFQGLATGLDYELPVDVYRVEDRNLRPEVLAELFRRVSLDGLWNWITQHPEMTRFMSEVYGLQQTTEGQLNAFITYRNEAAHDRTVVDVLSEEELCKLADFIARLCVLMAKYVEMRIWKRRVEQNPHMIVGQVTECFAVPKAVVAKVRNCRFFVGQSLQAWKHDYFQEVTVQSLQDNDKDITEFTATDEVELGLCFGFDLQDGTSLVDPAMLVLGQPFVGLGI